MFVRIKKTLLSLWDVLFPSLEGEDLESDDEIIVVQPVVMDILDREESVSKEQEDS